MSFDRREVHLEIPVAPEMEIAATALVSALGEWMQMERDKIEEVKTICWCGKKAAFNARFDEQGRVVKEGAQVVLGANDKYIGLCRKHWMAGDLGPDFGPRHI